MLPMHIIQISKRHQFLVSAGYIFTVAEIPMCVISLLVYYLFDCHELRLACIHLSVPVTGVLL